MMYFAKMRALVDEATDIASATLGARGKSDAIRDRLAAIERQI